MLLLGLLVDRMAPLILDELAVQLLNKLQMSPGSENDPITTQLTAIENRLETGPLKTGLEFLKLGDLREARHEFVRACVANPHSAVARLCLGILLYNEGQRQPGLENFKQAIEMNPFVCLPPLVQPSQIIALLNKQLSTPEETNLPKSPFWVQHLQDQSILQTIPPTDDLFALGHWLPTKGKTHTLLTEKMVKAGPILQACCNDRTIAIVWQLLEGPTTTRILSIFAQETGKCLWSMRLFEKQLQFTSSIYAILTQENEHYEFFSIETGQFITKMEKSIYEITFSPNVSYINWMDEYKRSHHTLKEKEDIETEAKFAYKAQTAKTLSPDKNTTPSKNYTKLYKDEYILTDPFGLSLSGIKVTNMWEYKNSFSGYRSLSRRIEELHCNAKVNTILLLKHD